MKFHRCIWACCTATLLLGSLAVLDAQASGRRGVYSPGAAYAYPSEPALGIGFLYAAPGMNYGYSYPAYPYAYNPYIAPYPGYGILPPPFALMNQYGNDVYAGTRRTAEDYGYGRDAFDTAPRKRPATYPATPFENPPVDRAADLRRVRFEIHVPTENAVVIFDGVETRQTGLKRTFQTPPMKEDVLFSSLIEIRWTDEAGKLQTRKEERKFVAGESLTVTIK